MATSANAETPFFDDFSERHNRLQNLYEEFVRSLEGNGFRENVTRWRPHVRDMDFVSLQEAVDHFRTGITTGVIALNDDQSRHLQSFVEVLQPLFIQDVAMRRTPAPFIQTLHTQQAAQGSRLTTVERDVADQAQDLVSVQNQQAAQGSRLTSVERDVADQAQNLAAVSGDVQELNTWKDRARSGKLWGVIANVFGFLSVLLPVVIVGDWNVGAIVGVSLAGAIFVGFIIACLLKCTNLTIYQGLIKIWQGLKMIWQICTQFCR